MAVRQVKHNSGEKLNAESLRAACSHVSRPMCSRFEKCTHKKSGTRPWPDAASLKGGQSLFLRYNGFKIGLLTVGTVTAGHRRAGDAELLQRCCDRFRIRVLGGGGSRRPQVRHPHHVILHDMAKQHAVDVWIVDAVKLYLLAIRVLQSHLILDLDHFNIPRI